MGTVVNRGFRLDISLTTQWLEKTEKATAIEACLRPHRVDEIHDLKGIDMWITCSI